MRSHTVLNSAIVSVVLFAATSAPGGIFNDVVRGLDVAGFQIVGLENPVSNKTSVAAGANFQGNPIDFGDFDVTMAGPVTFLFESGGRGIPTLDIGISSGLININPNRVFTIGQPQGMLYAVNFDSGLNTTNITGNMLFDGRLSINAFGSYDLRMQFSNRGTTTQVGRFDDVEPVDFDFDLGPVNIEGNIIADLLATVTDPLFEAVGFENIFASFSGRIGREEQLRSAAQRIRIKLENGGQLTQDDLSMLTGMAMVADMLGDDVPDLSFVSQAVEAGQFEGGDDLPQSTNDNIRVPEPTAVLLLCVGAASLLRRRRSAY